MKSEEWKKGVEDLGVSVGVGVGVGATAQLHDCMTAQRTQSHNSLWL